MEDQTSPIRIGAVCVAQIGNRFFLLVEFETGTMERVVIFRITPTQASELLNRGVDACRIVNEIPEPMPGTEVELLCAFTVGSEVFLVFDVENSGDELVLVRTDMCRIVG